MWSWSILFAIFETDQKIKMNKFMEPGCDVRKYIKKHLLHTTRKILVHSLRETSQMQGALSLPQEKLESCPYEAVTYDPTRHSRYCSSIFLSDWSDQKDLIVQEPVTELLTKGLAT